MKLPRPITIIRYAAAAYTLGMSLSFLGFAIWELATKGGLVLSARATEGRMDAGGAIMTLLWIASAIYTGWRGMDREALQSGSPQ